MYAIILLLVFILISPSTILASDMCGIAREMAKTSLELFSQDKKKGLSGLIQAHKLCPEDFKIAYNLGAAYYQYRRPDLAYEIWSKLGAKYKQNYRLISNLAWLALELGRLEEADKWVKKAISIKKDKELIELQIDILFKKGAYQEALDVALKNGLIKEVKKAGEYLAETMWNKFREGDREEALKGMITLAKKYPQVPILAREKDRMVLAMIDESQIPLPKPLPDQAFKQQRASLIKPKAEDEFLDLAHLKPTLKPGKGYALIVGIRKYKYLKGPRYADIDAQQMYYILVKRCGFKDDAAHIKLRLNQDASIGTLYNDLEWLIRKARLNPDAKIVFYFSGHGSPLVEGNSIKDGLLVPYEATLDGLNERTAIPLSYLRAQFAKLKNKNVVCILDACFSGTGKSISGMKLIRPKINLNLLSSNKLFISAAAANKPAREYRPGRQGAFTYFFIKALLGEGDKNGDSWVDTLEAFNYAKEKLEILEYDQDPQISIPLRIKLAKVK